MSGNLRGMNFVSEAWEPIFGRVNTDGGAFSRLCMRPDSVLWIFLRFKIVNVQNAKIAGPNSPVSQSGRGKSQQFANAIVPRFPLAGSAFAQGMDALCVSFPAASCGTR